MSATRLIASTARKAAETPPNFPHAYSVGCNGVARNTSSARDSSSRITLSPAAAVAKNV